MVPKAIAGVLYASWVKNEQPIGLVVSPPTASRPGSPGGNCTQAWMLMPLNAPPPATAGCTTYARDVVANVPAGNVNGETVVMIPAPTTSGVLPVGSTPRFGFEKPDVG